MKEMLKTRMGDYTPLAAIAPGPEPSMDFDSTHLPQIRRAVRVFLG